MPCQRTGSEKHNTHASKPDALLVAGEKEKGKENGFESMRVIEKESKAREKKERTKAKHSEDERIDTQRRKEGTAVSKILPGTPLGGHRISVET